MKKLIQVLVYAVAVPILFCQSAIADATWTKIEDNNGIETYARDVPGSEYREFKAVTIIDLPMSFVGAALRDIPEYPKWMDKVTEAKVIKPDEATHHNVEIYLVLHFPWPAQDRDVVLSGHASVDPKTGTVMIEGIKIDDSNIPPKSGLVRLPEFEQHFYMDYLNKHQMKIAYSIHLEAGGNLPVSVVESALKNVPANSLANLKDFAKSPKYARANPFMPDNIAITKAIAKWKMSLFYKDGTTADKVIENRKLLGKVVNSGYSEDVMTKARESLFAKDGR